MSTSPTRTIQNVGDRSMFGRQWLSKGRDAHAAGDVFGAFFAGYIALICSATQLMADNRKTKNIQSLNDDTWEKEAIEQSFRMRASKIMGLVRSDAGQRIVNSLRLREIPGDARSKIVSTVGDPRFAEVTDTLDALWSPARMSQWTTEEATRHAAACAYLFRRVRNRLFHGEKMNDPRGSDAELLDKLNPLLFEVTEILLVH